MIIKNLDDIKDELYLRRQSLGLTQEDVYKNTGITPATISRIENGRTFPKLDIFLKLIDYYKLNLVIS